MTYFFIFFGLGLELEIDQTFNYWHPLSTLYGWEGQRMDEGWVKLEI
jgi:hypothetical protein